ncbi:hypothetical protein Trydic_g20242 [Trypoxylus dichotomus]
MFSVFNTLRIARSWKRFTEAMKDDSAEDRPGRKNKPKNETIPPKKLAPSRKEDGPSGSRSSGPSASRASSPASTATARTRRNRAPRLKFLRRQEVYDRNVPKARMLAKSCYFKEDLSKRIDFVLVTTQEIFADRKNYDEIHTFLTELIDIGVQFEIDFGVSYNNHFFIKSHMPQSCVTHLTNLYHTDLSCVNPHYSVERPPRFACLTTELQKYGESELIERSPVSISGEKPSKATNAERSMLLHRLMTTTRYGNERNQYGLDSLCGRGLIIAAYPLHEGSYEWTTTGPLSDRQLLAAFWANYKMLFKKQPLNLIEQYFGTEIGMYFAWMEFYVKYLIPASVVGVLSFTVGSINTYITNEEYVTEEVCRSNKIMCPYCEHYSLCPFTPLKDACSYSRLGFLLDNPSTVFFSMFMSLWATYFMTMWKKRLAMLKLRWNVYHLHVEETVRQEFLLKATDTKLSRATGELEPYIPNMKHCTNFFVTNVTVMFCALVVFSVAISVIVYQYKMRYIAHISKDPSASQKASWIASITGSVFVGLSIMVFTSIYERIALWLTEKEYPRTQQTFDRSFIFKNCILNFSNSYAAITYLAFFRGKFFTYPGDTKQWNILGGITTDLCGPGGCLADVGIQMVVILTVPPMASCVAQFVKPYLQVKLKRYSNILFRSDIPQWELDFYLNNTYRYFLFNEYRDLLIQYGYITCFVCALPLAPLFALIRNIFEIRLDAEKLLKYHKRHIALKVDGLGAYSDVLAWITYFSVITNACVIAFSSNFIARAIYRLHSDIGLKGYINSTLSDFGLVEMRILESSFQESLERKKSVEDSFPCL